jgi:hypothetical protein
MATGPSGRSTGRAAHHPAGSTLADIPEPDAALRGRPWRLAATTVLAVVVLLGATGAFGVRSRTANSTGAGYRLSLTYPWIARAGLDVPWHVEIRRVGGFTGQKVVTLAVTARYFDIFETQGFHPEPDSESRDGRNLYLSFAVPPSGRVLEVDFDTYVQPSAQLGRRARVAVVDRGTEQVAVDIHTWLVP